MRFIFNLIVVLSTINLSYAKDFENKFNFPGGIYIQEINSRQFNLGLDYKGERVPTVQKNNKFYMIFGIPHSYNDNTEMAKLGYNGGHFIINPVSKKRTYGEQYIRISKKYTEPSKSNIERILKEKYELDNIKKKWVLKDFDTDFILPVIGTISGQFGTRRFYNGKEGNFHNGVDFAANIGTHIVSPSSGVVLMTGDFFYNGKFVYIDHGMNAKSIFIHMDETTVKVGDVVKKGELIGYVGNTGKSTGPHLHWSLTLNAVYVDPMIFVNNSLFD